MIAVVFIGSSITSAVAATMVNAGITCMFSCQLALLTALVSIAYAYYAGD